MNQFKLGALCSLLLTLAACGGGSSSDGGSSSSASSSSPGSSSSSSSSSPTGTRTGVFTDSPVAGVSYNTGSQSGVTNGKGEFIYSTTDTGVTFSVGGIDFPTVKPMPAVTPLDMGGEGATLQTTRVVNILRLLQTLDEDGDPENGITISSATSTALADVVLDFAATTFDSEASAAAQTAVNRSLVSAEQAVGHFQGSLNNSLLGSWVLEEDDGSVNVLTFLDSEHYIIAHSHSAGDQLEGSAEYGTYSWDPVTDAFSVTGVIVESDGEGGLYNAGNVEESQNITVQVTAEELSIVWAEGDGEEPALFSKASQANHALAGAWYIGETRGDHNVLTIYGENQYVVVHNQNSEAYAGAQPMGASSEWGTFSWNSSTGMFTIESVSVETNGDGGLYNAESDEPAAFNVQLQRNGDLSFSDSDEDFTFSRIGSFDVTLYDDEGDTSTAVVRRDLIFFADGVARTYYFREPVSGAQGVFNGSEFRQDSVALILESDGTGTISFPATDDEPVETNPLTWSLSSSGVLHVEEAMGEQTFSWRFTPVAGQGGARMLIEEVPQDSVEPGWTFIGDMSDSLPAQ